MSRVETFADNVGAQEQERVFGRVAKRVLPILMLAFLSAYIDRVNVGFAKLGMQADLGLSDAVYGLGAGIFFLGYFLFEVPSNIVLHRVGARRWIARIMVTWGVISGATMLVASPTQFYVARFLLGAAEAGFVPGVIYYLATWFPARWRGRILGTFYIALAGSGLVGGPLAGAILAWMGGIGGLAAWRWLFLIEALPSVIIGIAVYMLLDDTPAQASWLDADEKKYISEQIATEEMAKAHISIRALFADWRVLLLSFIFFLNNFAVYGLGFWMPTLIQNMGIRDVLQLGFISALPGGFAVLCMQVFGRSADYFRERRLHLVALYLIAAVGFVLIVVGQHDPIVGVAGLCLANMAIFTVPALFWALPTAILGGVSAAAGIAFINSLANLSGFLGPYIIGVVKTLTGGTAAPIYIIAIALCLGASLILLIPARQVNR